MNLIIITGNLGQDAQEKNFQGGQKYWVLNVATTETWIDKDKNKQSKTTWHRCQLTGNYDNLIPYLRKGQQVAIRGLQRHELYDFKDQNNGNVVQYNDKPIKMTMSFIKVERIELLGSANKENNSQSSGASASASATTSTDNAPTPLPQNEDDLPF
jgi:single-strand DNA-binding protein